MYGSEIAFICMLVGFVLFGAWTIWYMVHHDFNLNSPEFNRERLRQKQRSRSE